MTLTATWLFLWTSLFVVSSAAVDQESPPGCTSGFINKDVLTQRASKIGTATYGESTNVLRRTQFLVIPGMNFSCSGAISSFLLGAVVRNLPGNTLQVDLWRPQIESGRVISYEWVKEAHRYITLTPGVFSPDGLIRYSLSDKVQFQEGDVLGVWQPYSIDNRMRLFYTNELSPPLAYDINLRYISTHNVNTSGHDLFQGTILLLPVTDNDACLNGFLSETELRQQTLKVNINGVVSRPRQQRLFPDIQFTCNGSITKWIVGAQTRTVGITDELPSLQIWRRERGTNLYTQVGSSRLDTSTSNSSVVVEYIPNPPLEFQEGDILGVYQPDPDQSKLVLYYQRSTGPSSYGYVGDAPPTSMSLSNDLKFTKHDYPLVNVEVMKKEIKMIATESSSPRPPVFTDTNDDVTSIIIISLTIGIIVVVTAVILTVIMVAAGVWKEHNKSSSHPVVVVMEREPTCEEVLDMQENTSYERIPPTGFMTDQVSSQRVPYYAKVQLEQSLCSSDSSTESTSSIRSVEEVVYENIPPAANRNSNIVSSVNITMTDNPAYRVD